MEIANGDVSLNTDECRIRTHDMSLTSSKRSGSADILLPRTKQFERIVKNVPLKRHVTTTLIQPMSRRNARITNIKRPNSPTTSKLRTSCDCFVLGVCCTRRVR
jgi:hypothetical protein